MQAKAKQKGRWGRKRYCGKRYCRYCSKRGGGGEKGIVLWLADWPVFELTMACLCVVVKIDSI